MIALWVNGCVFSLLFSCTSIGSLMPSQEYCTEFGHTSGNPDFCNQVYLPADFGNGILFSVWTHIPDDLSTPVLNTLNRGNMIVYSLEATNWNLLALVGNIYVWGDGGAGYNANIMLGLGGVWAGDYSCYQTLEMNRMSIAAVSDWIWVAWQVVINPDKSFTFRQWLKFGAQGTVQGMGDYLVSPDGEENVSLSYLRAFVTDTPHPDDSIHNLNAGTVHNGGNTMSSNEAAVWEPGPLYRFQIGWDNSYSGVGEHGNSYLYHARMEALSTKPTLSRLEEIANLTSPDTSAWGDWSLEWSSDMSGLQDRSGQGHHLTISNGGSLNQGIPAPVL